jgi:NAD/NADP transhydrogenase beta subunit
MVAGYAGLNNEPFFGQELMVFGDAKKVVENMCKAIQ